MAWLFERTIETAAWVAFILGIIFLCESVWLLVEWARHMGEDGGVNYLRQSGTAAASFVAAALGMGLLVCIDRYVFDIDEAK
jgi:Na+-driven multidrug efflux pump